MSSLVRLVGDFLCPGVLHFLNLFDCSIPPDVLAIYLSDFVYLLVFWVFADSLSALHFAAKKFLSDVERKMLDVRYVNGSVSTEDGISKETESGNRYYDVSKKWSSWSRGRDSKARRGKVYCDKWIHEGFCAFRHVGCKYLHVMPMDAAIQLKLGLENGLPRWYSIRTENWRQIKKSANSGHDNMGATTYDTGNDC